MPRSIKIIILTMVMLIAGVIVVVNSQTQRDRALSSVPPVFSSSASPIIPLGISVAEAASLPQGIALIESNINITGPRGERINELVDLELKTQDNGEYGLVVNKKDTQAFKPGRYHLSADIQTKQGIRRITQDFLWGVLAINPNKSVYHPGETAHLALAVLDEKGMMVCDAQLTLQVQSPKSQVKNLSIENGNIRVNPECQTKDFTTKPDFETYYRVSGPGTYHMTLTATTKNGTYTIEDYFEVKESIPFDIERITATRIYPVHEYPVTLRIMPERDFMGTVREQVPSSFDVNNFQFSNSSFQIISNDQSSKQAKLLEWNVDWKAGETYELSYIYKSPEISPQFYLLGPLKFQDRTGTIIYQDERPWQIAVDVVYFNDTFTEASDIVLTSHTPDTGTGWAVTGIGTCSAYIDSADDVLDAQISVSSGGCGTSEGFIARTADIMSTADYQVSVTVTTGESLDDTNILVCRIQNADNMYGVLFNNDSSTLYKKESAVWSTIDTGGAGVANGSTATLKCNGSTISFEDDGVELLSATDTTHASAGRAGVGMGAVIVSTDDVDTQELDNFQVSSIANNPSITTASDTPDPTNPGRSVTFITDWSDSDSGETVKVKVCKSSTLSSQNCTDGYWASSTSFTALDPESVVYDIVGGDAGTTRHYYVHVCDDGGSCTSTSTTGTFAVNLFSTLPNTLIRGASGSGAGKVNLR